MANDDDLRLKSFPPGSFFVFYGPYFPSFAIRDWAVSCYPRWRASFTAKREGAVFWMHNAVPVRIMKAMAIPYAGRSIWMSMFLMYRWRSCCE